MNANLVLSYGSLKAPSITPKTREIIKKVKYGCTTTARVVSRPKETIVVLEKKEETTAYKDNWLELLAIRYISKNLQSISGLRNEQVGYESLVEAAIAVSRNFEAQRQRDLSLKSIDNALPSFLPQMIKRLFPPSKFSREIFAVFATLFFAWLVGPCEVKESELEGRREKNVVYIPKCRLLESTKCVGTCTNLCKIPCQKFIHDSLGMPLYMVPNFEDMSCEMKFGEKPPLDDPTLNQPCYKSLCLAKQWHGT